MRRRPEFDEIAAVLPAYPDHLADAEVVTAVVGGGFSGARLWRLHTAAGDYGVRQWPISGPDARRLAWIHRVIRFAAEHGCSGLAVAQQTRQGETFVEHAGQIWEIAPWLPGSPAVGPPCSSEQVAAALEALAEFHLAVGELPPPEAGIGPARVIAERLDRVETLLRGDWQAIASAVRNGRLASIDATATAAMGPIEKLLPPLAIELSSRRTVQVPWCPCLRDIWRQNVLFAGGQVSGIIDYGALRTDSPATDIVRLLGSLAANDDALWQTGLAAYESRRPLAHGERSSLAALDHSTVVLSCVNWLEWLYRDRKAFADIEAVARQFLAAVSRLFNLNDRVDRGDGLGPGRTSTPDGAEGKTKRLWLPGEP
ncbi:MAG: phosphotransferase [Pirellulales bacterium]|nr:phosphotransferase [Pirellulales bacterium]